MESILELSSCFFWAGGAPPRTFLARPQGEQPISPESRWRISRGTGGTWKLPFLAPQYEYIEQFLYLTQYPSS